MISRFTMWCFMERGWGGEGRRGWKEGMEGGDTRKGGKEGGKEGREVKAK